MDSKKKIYNLAMFGAYFVYDVIITLLFYYLNIDNNTFKHIYLIVTSLIYLVFVIFVYRNELKIDLKNLILKKVLKYIPIYIIGISLMILSNYLISKITNVNLSENEIRVREYIKLFPIYMTFSTVIYAPIVEEITFRKTFRNIINNGYLFVIISGIIFGLVHIKTGSLQDFLMIIPYIIMGIDLSYIYYKSDNIFTSMIIHCMHNLVLLIMQFIGG